MSLRFPCVFYSLAVLLWGMLASVKLVASGGLWPAPAWELWVFGVLGIVFIFSGVVVAWDHYVYLLAALIPLEFSVAVAGGPLLSPVDYVCVALLLAAAWRLKIRLPGQALKVFGRSGVVLWAGFLIWGMINAHMQNGDPRPVLRWGEFLFCYFLGCQAVSKNPRTLQRLAGVVVLSAGIVSVAALTQFMRGDYTYMAAKAFFGQHNITAAFVNFALPVSFAAPSFLSIPFLSAALPYLLAAAWIICYSRGAWIGMIAGVVLVGFHRKQFFGRAWRFSFKTSLIIFAASVLFFCTMSRGGRSFWSGRDTFSATGAAILKERPWMGLGPGNYARNMPAYLSSAHQNLYYRDPVSWQHLHNFYLQTLVEYGIAGGVLLFAALGRMLWKAWRRYREAPLGPYWMMSLIAFLVHNLVDILMVNSFDLLFAVILACLAFSISYKKRGHIHEFAQT
jgi:hypothetical protein